MAIYSTLQKLGRVQLPGSPATTYALIDVDGRAVIAPNFSSLATYNSGDHVFYQDNLYRAIADISTAGSWDSTKWENVTVDSEIKRLENILSGGIHYRGKTTSVLYDGVTTNPIVIGGSSYTAESGDLVIVDLSSVASAYAVSTAYSVHTYISNNGAYYIVEEAITASENTGFSAIESKLSLVSSNPEFLFDGTIWNALGSLDDGLGALAWKNSASGTYVKPTGSGSVTIKTYTETSKYLERTTITGTDGTVDASEVTGGTSKTQWKQDSTNPTINYGNADVGTAVTYGTANPGTAVTGVAKVGSQKTFNTDAIKVSGVTEDCLVFVTAETDNVIGIADTTGVSITPAVASNTTLTPAKACDSTRTAVNLVSDGTLTGSYTITPVTPAKIASSATTVATGGTTTSADGDIVLTQLTQDTESATVTVGTTTDTVTVK